MLVYYNGRGTTMNEQTSSYIDLTKRLLEANVNLSGVQVIELSMPASLEDYLDAMAIANNEAPERLGDVMLVSWYDRDRDFESPQHSSECHLDSVVPGYIDYGISHGAKLMIDIEKGRLVFLYIPVNI